jgi:hypothetical protein
MGEKGMRINVRHGGRKIIDRRPQTEDRKEARGSKTAEEKKKK